MFFNDLINQYQKVIVPVTYYNLLIMIFVLLILLQPKYIKEENKYEMLNDIKNFFDLIFGKWYNENIIIYIIIFLHGLSGFGLGSALFFTKSIKILLINFLIQFIVLTTNLHYKGCLAHKYEKLVLKDRYHPSFFILNLYFKLHYYLFNKYPEKHEQVLTIFIFFYCLCLLLLMKLIYMIYKI